MGKAEIRSEFYNTYFELDALCSAKLGISGDGIADYTVRLTNTRFAPEREGILGRLTRYRLAKDAIANGTPDAAEHHEISRDDLKWMKKFEKDLINGKDPLSKYLRRRGSGVGVRIAVSVIAVIAVAAVGIAAHLLGWISALFGMIRI